MHMNKICNIYVESDRWWGAWEADYIMHTDRGMGVRLPYMHVVRYVGACLGMLLFQCYGVIVMCQSKGQSGIQMLSEYLYVTT